MRRIVVGIFAGMISLAASAQVPTDFKQAVKEQADTAIDKGHESAQGKTDQAKSSAEAKTDSAKAAVDQKAAGVPVAGEVVQGATSAGAEKAKSHAKKAHGTTSTKTGKGASKAHKKVDELAK